MYIYIYSCRKGRDDKSMSTLLYLQKSIRQAMSELSSNLSVLRDTAIRAQKHSMADGPGGLAVPGTLDWLFPSVRQATATGGLWISGSRHVLGGSQVVISGVISPLKWVITIVTLLITPTYKYP